MSYNKVILAGNLGAAPEMRQTSTGKSVVTLSIATSEGKDQVEWHKVVVWNEQAELCQKYLDKGSKVLIEGRLTTRSWDDKSGQKRFSTEIQANRVVFLSPKSDGMKLSNNPGPKAASTRGKPVIADELPDDDSFEEVK